MGSIKFSLTPTYLSVLLNMVLTTCSNQLQLRVSSILDYLLNHNVIPNWLCFVSQLLLPNRFWFYSLNKVNLRCQFWWNTFLEYQVLSAEFDWLVSLIVLLKWPNFVTDFFLQNDPNNIFKDQKKFGKWSS